MKTQMNKYSNDDIITIKVDANHFICEEEFTFAVSSLIKLCEINPKLKIKHKKGSNFLVDGMNEDIIATYVTGKYEYLKDHIESDNYIKIKIVNETI